MVDFQYKDSYGVKDLEEIVRLLRAPGGMRAAPST